MTQAETLKANITSLRNELAQYVGARQADHHIWLIEMGLESECLKRDGMAWLKRTIRSLERILTAPTYTTLMQTSPETESWGGFLSQDVSLVPSPSLREQFGVGA